MKLPFFLVLSAALLLPACGGGPSTQADTAAPNVALSAAQSSTTVALSADASDNVGVSKVEFYRGSQLIATGTAAPYTASDKVKASMAGNATYTAKAYDAAGNVGQSSQVIKLTFATTLYQGVWGWAIGDSAGAAALDSGAAIFSDETPSDNRAVAVGVYRNVAQTRSGIAIMGPVSAAGKLETAFSIDLSGSGPLYFVGVDGDNTIGLYQGRPAFEGTGALLDANNQPTQAITVDLVQTSATVPGSLTAQTELKTQARALALSALQAAKFSSAAQSVSPALLKSVQKASSLLR